MDGGGEAERGVRGECGRRCPAAGTGRLVAHGPDQLRWLVREEIAQVRGREPGAEGPVTACSGGCRGDLPVQLLDGDGDRPNRMHLTVDGAMEALDMRVPLQRMWMDRLLTEARSRRNSSNTPRYSDLLSV